MSTLEATPTSMSIEPLPQLRVAAYICVATLTAWTWDLLINFEEELLVFPKGSMTLSYGVYAVSRVSSLLFVLLSCLYEFGVPSECQYSIIAVGALSAVAVPANSFLMYLRIQAVYHHSPTIRTAFGVFWLVVLGAGIAVPLSLQGAAHNGRCACTSLKPFGAAGLFAAAINDTLIFLAITYRILTSHSSSGSRKDFLKSFLRGEGLYDTSKLLLQTGQLYYLATAGMSIFAVTNVLLVPNFSPIIRGVFTAPNIALTNNMTCRVFRQVKRGFIQPDYPSQPSVFSEPTFGRARCTEVLTDEHDLYLISQPISAA